MGTRPIRTHGELGVKKSVDRSKGWIQKRTTLKRYVAMVKWTRNMQGVTLCEMTCVSGCYVSGAYE
jgi:hypothetical protein